MVSPAHTHKYMVSPAHTHISPAHTHTYMKQQYPRFMFWTDEELLPHMRDELTNHIAEWLQCREESVDAQTVLLSEDSFQWVRTAPFVEALKVLQTIRDEKNRSFLPLTQEKHRKWLHREKINVRCPFKIRHYKDSAAKEAQTHAGAVLTCLVQIEASDSDLDLDLDLDSDLDLDLYSDMSGAELTAAAPLKTEENDSELERAKRELQEWKAKVEKADDVKSGLILRKLEEESEKKKVQNALMDLIKKRQEEEKERRERGEKLRAQLSVLTKTRMELMDKLKRTTDRLETSRAEARKLQHRFKICAPLPPCDLEFVRLKQEADDVRADEPIRGCFSVSQQGALLLRGGQALITFEEERVVSQILQMDSCLVSFDDQTLEVKPKRIRTEPIVQFEIELLVSRCHVDVSEVVSLMSKQQVEQCLALSFSRPSRGGAEVQKVELDQRQGRARVQFLSPGVSESLCVRAEHLVDLESQTKVKVSPVYEHRLHKFQSFCGAPKRTLLLDNVRDTGDAEEVQDQLEIHFQKPSNGGGEIEHTRYVSPGSSLLVLLSADL
ncbi:hypothetical protein WMY93_033093 [Mugilogobius chulae]|uniref:NID domain-containing protein n=1 Tax=Mugilogobius chulae TaxID=88201 RepID=A0AAW0MUB5_9GOBI